MARGKKTDGVVAIAALIVTAIVMFAAGLIILAAIAGAIALPLLWAIAFVRAAQLEAAPCRNAFTWTADEARMFAEAKAALEAEERQLAQLWAQGAHLSKRNDGWFQERSALAKELNQKIGALQRTVGITRMAVNVLALKPSERKSRYAARLGQFRALSGALITAIVVTLFLVIVQPPVFLPFATWLDSTMPATTTAKLMPLLIGAAACGVAAGWLYFGVFVGSRIARESEAIDSLKDAPAGVAEQFTQRHIKLTGT